MGRLISIGYGNVVNTDKIVAVISPDSAPSKRLIQTAKDSGLAIDGTQGRKTKAIIVMESCHVVLSALLPETITMRYHNQNSAEVYEENKDDDE